LFFTISRGFVELVSGVLSLKRACHFNILMKVADKAQELCNELVLMTSNSLRRRKVFQLRTVAFSIRATLDR
jgi:hypothetical protein